MKRIIVLLVVLVGLILACVGCTGMVKGVCDNCGQTEYLREFQGHGSVFHLCEDCYRMAKMFY